MTDDDFRNLIAELRRKLEKIEVSAAAEFDRIISDDEFRKLVKEILKKTRTTLQSRRVDAREGWMSATLARASGRGLASSRSAEAQRVLLGLWGSLPG